jgi:glycine hydroxymethyltransferase
MTTAGMGEPEMGEVAALVGRALRGRDDESALAAVADEVRVLCAKFPPYPPVGH